MSSTVPGTLGRFDTYLWNGQVLILPSLHRLPECSVSSRFLDLMPSSLGLLPHLVENSLQELSEKRCL